MTAEGNNEMSQEDEFARVKEKLTQETERLTKLFDAYEEQHRELLDTKAEVEVLERDLVDKEIEKEGLENLLREKDDRYRDIETETAKLKQRVEYFDVELPKMEEKYTREKDRLGRVFELAEELDDDLRLAVAEMKARDDWYVEHLQLFEDLNKAIQQRYEMVEAAVESERNSQHRRRALKEQIESLVEMRAAEMTVDEAEQKITSEAESKPNEPDTQSEEKSNEPDTQSEEKSNEPDTQSEEKTSEDSENKITLPSTEKLDNQKNETDDISIDGITFSESVLSRVMASYDISLEEKDSFVKFSEDFDSDNNGYLRSSEIEAAAKAWNEKEN